MNNLAFNCSYDCASAEGCQLIHILQKHYYCYILFQYLRNPFYFFIVIRVIPFQSFITISHQRLYCSWDHVEIIIYHFSYCSLEVFCGLSESVLRRCVEVNFKDWNSMRVVTFKLTCYSIQI